LVRPRACSGIKFDVSEAEFAATLRGGHTRNASPCLGRIAARFIAELKSNKLSQPQPPDANNQAGNENQHFKNPTGLRAVAIHRKK
jgi:hypothetical protein